MNKLNSMGIGPVIAGITFPWLIIAVYLSLKLKGVFSFLENANRILYFVGLVLVLAGTIMYFFTIPALLKGLRENKLVTTGVYSLCCNPLYVSIILFIIPGISFMMNSWLVLTTSIVAFSLFKIYIKNEYAEMEKFFGENYRKYRARTPEFLPIPLKKWLRRA